MEALAWHLFYDPNIIVPMTYRMPEVGVELDMTYDSAAREGDFLDYEYHFSRPHDGVVARVSKQWFSWADTYGVDIADTGLNGVLITPEEDQRTFKLFSQPWVAAMDRLISVTGEPATTVPERYAFAAPPVTLRITERPKQDDQVARAEAR